MTLSLFVPVVTVYNSQRRGSTPPIQTHPSLTFCRFSSRLQMAMTSSGVELPAEPSNENANARVPLGSPNLAIKLLNKFASKACAIPWHRPSDEFYLNFFFGNMEFRKALGETFVSVVPTVARARSKGGMTCSEA